MQQYHQDEPGEDESGRLPALADRKAHSLAVTRNQQLSLDFDTLDEAIAYAQKNAIPFHVYEPHKPAAKAKSYSDNFRFDRKIPWTH